jgi:hypothetical protein
MTDPTIVLVRDAILVLLTLGTCLIVFFRLSNTSFTVKFESKTVAQEPAKANMKRLAAERDEARVAAQAMREKLEKAGL